MAISMTKRVEQLRRKMHVRHWRYWWLRVDERTQPEVEESRLMEPRGGRVKRETRMRKRLSLPPRKIKRDLDGAFRVLDRLDKEKPDAKSG